MESEGNIIFIEKYGAFRKERHYVKPKGQDGIVLRKEEKCGTIVSFLRQTFIPKGFPDTVSRDYMQYQIWDTSQAFCSTIAGILATQEVLRGVGVGDTSATPLAATVTWVIKDGCGHLGRILFAYTHGSHLDAYSKKWRLYADILNDAAMCIEIALPLFKGYVTFALSVSTVMKAIVGVAGGATRVAMTQHHALAGNIGDVAAKDAAQETAVNLIASLSALVILSAFGNSLFIFMLMLIFHIVFNYLAVRAVCLRTLNVPRYLQVIDNYLRNEVISTPCQINRTEPIIFYQLGHSLFDLKISGFQIKLGQSLERTIKYRKNAEDILAVKEIYKKNKYLLFPNIKSKIMYVYLEEGITVEEILCAYFHAVLLSILTCSINYSELPFLLPKKKKDRSTPFIEMCKMVQMSDNMKNFIDGAGYNFEPSRDLHESLAMTVENEWQSFRSSLLKTGWDLSKHLLVVEEWRIQSETSKEKSS